jgi:hypothetical protein
MTRARTCLSDPDSNLLQQLIAWLWTGTNLSKIVLFLPDLVVAGPCVMWMAPPGAVRKWDGGTTVNITHESFGHEKMQAIAWQFYLDERVIPQPSNS